MTYGWRYDWSGGALDDGQGHLVADPPTIYITKDGYDWLELLEDATPTVEYPDTEHEHWAPPEVLLKLVDLLQNNLALGTAPQ